MEGDVLQYMQLQLWLVDARNGYIIMHDLLNKVLSHAVYSWVFI